MRIIYIVLVLMGLQAHAVVLKDIPAAPENRLPIDTAEPSVPCDQIVERLLKYNQMARENDASISGFLGEVTMKLTEWYDLLSPLEGTPQTLKAGTFSPLQRGSEQISNITNLAFDNSDLLAQELDKIVVSLQACGVGSGAP
jgi:hypothetical protein